MFNDVLVRYLHIRHKYMFFRILTHIIPFNPLPHLGRSTRPACFRYNKPNSTIKTLGIHRDFPTSGCFCESFPSFVIKQVCVPPWPKHNIWILIIYTHMGYGRIYSIYIYGVCWQNMIYSIYIYGYMVIISSSSSEIPSIRGYHV